jgi:hypothetical protein
VTFWDRVDKTGDCWLWTGNTRRGYGVYWSGGRRYPAHRWSFEQANGPIPDGLVIDHMCRVKSCVNPAHLRAVTQRVNVMAGDTIVAAEAARTVCDHGHPLAGENVRLTPEGWRECLPCARARWRRKADRQKIARGGAQ